MTNCRQKRRRRRHDFVILSRFVSATVGFDKLARNVDFKRLWSLVLLKYLFGCWLACSPAMNMSGVQAMLELKLNVTGRY